MQLKLYNTLTKTIQPFTPIHHPNVGIYCCGPTVYHYAHIGNLRTYIFEDILIKTLKFLGYTVKHVMNITDVGHLTSDSDTGEDKMEKGASREKKSVWDIAQQYTDAFKQDLEKLHIAQPDIWCKATDHIKEQIAQIQVLEKKGFTYQIADGIYFDTAKYPQYKDFARLDIENLSAGIRVEMVEGKRNPTDFALWKFSPKNTTRAMEWESPWGKGFPGWHIECSAMSMKYLGNEFDIHCGGIDHVQVHHTNEIAQAQCSTGKTPWVRFWLHGEFMVLAKQEKMSKSSENFLTISLLEQKGYTPTAYRFLCLQTHYKKQLMFSFESLDSAKTGYARLKQSIQQMTGNNGTDASKYIESFTQAMCDNLNTPSAVAIVFELIADKELSVQTKKETIALFDKILSLDLLKEQEKVEIPQHIQELAQQRIQAKQQKNFALADQIRQQALEQGYKIVDTKTGFDIQKV
jgi:cysteinyl-tRNA synthetase